MNLSHGLLLTVILSITTATSASAQQRTSIDARSKALGLERKELPDDQNPVLALQKPLKRFQEQTQNSFKTDVGLSRFTDFSVNRRTLQLSRTLQRKTLRIFARGPGQIPSDLEIDDFNIFLLVHFRRANCALAVKALANKDTRGAASHLAKSFEAADYIMRSAPTLVPYSVAVFLFKRNTYEDLLELFARTSDLEILDQVEALRRKHPYDPDLLAAALRDETRFNMESCKQLKNFIQEQNKTFPEFWKLLSIEPLKNCTLRQLLNMSYERDKSLHLVLDSLEGDLRWVNSGKPVATHPDVNLKSDPHPLAYYQEAPNGLFEIFEDCDPHRIAFHILAVHALLDTFIETAVACLRAEANGVQVVTLSSLVPKYLSKIPIDFNDGKPLRYLPKKRILYSVGVDMKDDRGVSNLDLTEEEDLDATFDQTFRIPRIASKPNPITNP